MHTEFKKILAKITERKHLPGRAKADAHFQEKQRKIEEFKAQVGITYKESSHKSDIQKILGTYTNLNKLSKLIIIYLESEINTITNQLDSGQCLEKEKFDLEQERNQLETLLDHFFGKTYHFNRQSAKFVSARSFLQIMSPSYDFFNHAASKIEPNLYFLGDDFVRDVPGAKTFKRIKLDLSDFRILSEFHLCASSPQQLCYFIKTFLNINTDENIAIACFEPRYAGFIIYPNQNPAVEMKLTELSNQHPALLRKDHDQDFWLLTLESNQIINFDFLSLFSTWLDADSLTIYRKTDLFPITINEDIPIDDFINTDYEIGIFFDYTTEPTELSQKNISTILNQNDPYAIIKNIEFFNGQSFINVKSDIFWTFSELLLIKYKVAEDLEKLVFFDTQAHRVLLETNTNSFETPMLKDIYALNLDLLNINSLETFNPNELVR